MLALLQVINYMLVNLEYTEDEVKDAFRSVETGEIAFSELLGVLGLELNKTSLELATSKINRWPSAMRVVLMREGLV
jgi:hypothetical protein